RSRPAASACRRPPLRHLSRHCRAIVSPSPPQLPTPNGREVNILRMQKKRAGVSSGPSLVRSAPALAAVAHEAQQELEHVDEVEIEAERAHDHGLALHLGPGDI